VDCFSVVEENDIVFEVEFEEKSGGGYAVSGEFVTEDGTRERGNSRFNTIMSAKSRIEEIAYMMQLQEPHVNAALRTYKLALQLHFTRGRKKDHVYASCLYIACRRDKTPHLLIDFVDSLGTNLFELGHTFLALCKTLNVSLPPIDPSLFIHRFSALLEFDDKENIVAETAIKIVQRMNRDWIVAGRRPSGICGAALIMAARVHGFNRTFEEVIPIVKISESTLKKRINEFLQTPSSDLTPSQFDTMDLFGEENPPCLTQNRINEGKKDKKSISPKVGEKRKRDSEDSKQEKKKRKSNNGEGKSLNENKELHDEIESLLLALEKEFSDVNPDTQLQPIPEQKVVKISFPKTPENFGNVDFKPHFDENGVDTLSDIDDDEVDSYLLPNEESKSKNLIWFYLHRDYFKEEEKRLNHKKLTYETFGGGRRGRKKKSSERKNKIKENRLGYIRERKNIRSIRRWKK